MECCSHKFFFHFTDRFDMFFFLLLDTTKLEMHYTTLQYINYCSKLWHHGSFLVNDQRDTQILFYIFISIYNSLHVPSTSCSSSGETNCVNTASGNSHSILVAEICAESSSNLHIFRPPT